MKQINSIKNKDLREIAQKVLEEVPVSGNDAKIMLSTKDILELGLIADYIRKKINGNNTYYGVNININYTNICELRCPLCAYSKDRGEEGAFLLSLDEIDKRVKNAVKDGIDEVHIVGGLNPDIDLEYYTELLKKIKNIKKDIFIVAFTAVEYDYISKKFNIPLEKVFEKFIDAGLNSLPGGGAEIFSAEKRAVIAPKKIPARRWLEVMRTAHKMGLKTNATMLYNHIESTDDIIDHLSQLRALQDETGGFKTFVPLPFHEENTEIKSKNRARTGFDDIRIYAASRIFLHNIPHIKALWMYLGEKMAQTLLNFGVDDISGTYSEEKVVHAAGARTPDIGSKERLIHLINNTGTKPVRTNAGYKSL